MSSDSIKVMEKSNKFNESEKKKTKMLPTTSRSRSSSSSSSSSSRANLPDLALLLLHPELTQCSFKTKNQWTRDDPAFIVICSLLLIVATLAYCATYDHSGSHAVVVVVSVFLTHFLITGAVIATCTRTSSLEMKCLNTLGVMIVRGDLEVERR